MNTFGEQGSGVSEEGSAMQKVSDLASGVKDQATGLAHDAARVVRDRAGALAESAKGAASGAGEKLLDTAEAKKNAGAEFVSGIAGAVRRAAGAFDDQIPHAGEYIRQAADQLDGASNALRQRNVTEMVEGVQDFARRQPTAFLGMTVLAGFAAVRFLNSTSVGGSARRDKNLPSVTPQSENARRLGGVSARHGQGQI